MKLEESLGIVTEDGKQWSSLCNAIVDFIYDVKDGLNANPFNEEQRAVYMSNIVSFYKYKNGSIQPELIPDWIGDFEIKLDNDLTSKGRFEKGYTELKDRKLYFSISIKDYVGKTIDEFYETLIHEFRHAYTTWIEKSKNISIHKKLDGALYKASYKGFHNEKYDKEYQMVKEFGVDYLVLDNDIYSNPTKMELIILKSFYYIDIDEINSFLQQYAESMKKQINITYKKEIEEDLEKVLTLKKNFNALTRSQKWESNLLNSMRVTPYNSRYFRNYMAYVEFWKGIELVDEEIANEVVSNIKRAIKLYLHIDVTKRLINYDGDAINILKLILKKELPVFLKVIYKMNRIYARLISSALDTYKLNKIIDNEINNSEFELELFK